MEVASSRSYRIRPCVVGKKEKKKKNTSWGGEKKGKSKARIADYKQIGTRSAVALPPSSVADVDREESSETRRCVFHLDAQSAASWPCELSAHGEKRLARLSAPRTAPSVS